MHHGCVCSLPHTLRGGVARSLLRSVGSCKRVLRVGARRGRGPKLVDGTTVGQCEFLLKVAAWAIKNTMYSSLCTTTRE
jgi:hypothetical protein